MLKIASKFLVAGLLVAVPFAFIGCDKMKTETTKETVTTDRDGDVVKHEETTTTTTKDE